MSWLWSISGAAAAVLLRLYFFMKMSAVAVDEHYWKLYRSARRRNLLDFTPRIDGYLLDIRHWYVPVYGLFIALLPDGLFRHGARGVCILLLLLRFGLYWALARMLGAEPGGAVVATGFALYIFNPISFLTESQLNSRQLGAIVFDLIVITLFLGLTQPVWLIAAALLMALLMLLHKLTLQLLAVLLAVLACGGVWQGLALLLPAFGLALLCGFRRYLPGMLETWSFWYRNRLLPSADQIADSPIYGSPAKAPSSGYRAVLHKLLMVFGMYPYWPLVFCFDCPLYWRLLMLGVLGWALLTTFVERLLCFGMGRSYPYYMPVLLVFPLLLAGGQERFSALFVLLLAGGVLYTLGALWQLNKWVKSRRIAKNQNYYDALEYLKNSDGDRIMVIPITVSDEVCAFTGKSTLWGGHGLGIKLIEPYYPVLRHRVERAFEDWNLGVILIRKSSWAGYEKALDMDLFAPVFENADYIVLARKGWRNASRIPQWARDAYPGMSWHQDEAPDL